MKYFFTPVFIITCLISFGVSRLEAKGNMGIFDKKYTPAEFANTANADPDSTKAAKKKSQKKASKSDNSAPASAAPAGDAKTSGKKDPENQTQFFKPDMESQEYNFYDRKKISTPLMPRYDLDSAVYQKGFKKKEEQQKAFIENKYRYPARPKDQWEVGLQFGSMLIAGDIHPDWTKGWGGGFTVRKAINYFFSVRLSYTYSQSKALDLKPREDVEFDPALNGQANNADYYHSYSGGLPTGVDPKIIFHNYRNRAHMAHLDGILNLGNILFHRERNWVNVNVLFGVGFHMYRTQMDMLNSNGQIYDFSSVLTDYQTLQSQNASQATMNKTIGNDLAHLLSGNYTVDAVDPLKGSFKIGKFNMVPDFSPGLGLDIHASKWITVGVEERFIFNSNSNLDGVNWQDDGHPGLAPHYDHYFSTMVHLNFNLGKNRVEPLWWLNPMDFTYKKLSDVNPDKLAKDLFKDTDEDGVPDILDKEPNTKKGCPVDAHGVILDSDKDGIPDCDDKEPFSPPGYPIDQNGVAIIPPNPCCDNDTTGDAPNGGPGSRKKNKGGAGNNGGYDCSKIEMPGVFFDDDKYYIDPAYYSALHQVAEKLQMCPDVKMVVTGIDESKNDQKYNEQLGYNRATSVVDYLVEKYGISRDRFLVKYVGGKKSNANQTPQDKKKARRVDFNYAADGEKGESNPPAPHPGLKAGSNK